MQAGSAGPQASGPKALDRFVEGSVCPNTNEGLAQRSPVLTNARAHASAADRLEIGEFIAQSVALHSQGCVFSLDVTDSTKLASRGTNELMDAFASGHLGAITPGWQAGSSRTSRIRITSA